jgi:hypothetical protein
MKVEGLEAYRERYREAIERVLPELPVENGTISIDSIWVETSLPRDLIIEIVQEGLKLPPNVERVLVPVSFVRVAVEQPRKR